MVNEPSVFEPLRLVEHFSATTLQRKVLQCGEGRMGGMGYLYRKCTCYVLVVNLPRANWPNSLKPGAHGPMGLLEYLFAYTQIYLRMQNGVCVRF